MGNAPPTAMTRSNANDDPKKNDDAVHSSSRLTDDDDRSSTSSLRRRKAVAPPPRCLPLSHRLIGSLAGGIYCQECRRRPPDDKNNDNASHDPFHSFLDPTDATALSGNNNNSDQHHDYNLEQVARDHSAVISPLVLAPLLHPLESTETSVSNNNNTATTTTTTNIMATLESIMAEYIATCKFYGCRVNAGVLTTLRFTLPSLRVSGDFHDADMLALAEILLRHGNGPLRFIKRLDFSRSSQEGKEHNGQGKPGFRSHGAFTLSKVLQTSEFVQEVRLQGNRLGPYGASAIFLACSRNQTIQRLAMRRCLIGEKGGLAFAELLHRDMEDQKCGLVDVDLSVNRIGFRASVAIEEAMNKRVQNGQDSMYVDLMGNLVLQEVG